MQDEKRLKAFGSSHWSGRLTQERQWANAKAMSVMQHGGILLSGLNKSMTGATGWQVDRSNKKALKMTAWHTSTWF